MSFGFLRDYTIPTITTHKEHPNPSNWEARASDQINPLSSLQMPPPPPIGLLEYGRNEELSQPQQSGFPSFNRFIPPGKQRTNFNPPPPRPVKRKFSETAATKSIAESTADGKLVIFQGRDITYPDELNRLIHPLKCELCTTQMNSMQSAKDHYESKAHDRNITTWLNKNFTDKGLKPPDVKRFFKSGPIGPEAFRCELCDLKLTSLTHANQHYSGRKHRLVAKNISKPSGAGYYDAEGKWVRTGSKLIPTSDNDGRFGIGEQFKQTPAGVPVTNDNSDPDTTTSVDGQSNAAPVSTPNDLHCSLCNINVTSAAHMTMHLVGAKHSKKLKQSTDAVPSLKTSESDSGAVVEHGPKSILASLSDSPNNDLSMYRTPTGSYYCSVCNSAMCHISALQQHLLGKKHIKKAAEENAKTSASAPTPK